jgi:leucyl-tRNA synthetase
MTYNFKTIEPKWQKYWFDNKTFKTENEIIKPKYYVLNILRKDFTLVISNLILQPI